jgi:ureidoglycolate hydrolase
MSIKQLKINNLEEFSNEEFAPYGQIWGREEGEPLEVLENLKFYSYEEKLEPAVEMVESGFLICNEKGRKIRYFERHPETSEIFIPIHGQCIFVMAPGDDGEAKPDVSRLKAFYLSGNLGVALPAGNWHWPPIPLGKQVKLLLIRKGSNSDPCDIVELKDIGLEGIQIIL